MANNAARIKRHAAHKYNLGECGHPMLVSIIRHYSPCRSTRPAHKEVAVNKFIFFFTHMDFHQNKRTGLSEDGDGIVDQQC